MICVLKDSICLVMNQFHFLISLFGMGNNSFVRGQRTSYLNMKGMSKKEKTLKTENMQREKKNVKANV